MRYTWEVGSIMTPDDVQIVSADAKRGEWIWTQWTRDANQTGGSTSYDIDLTLTPDLWTLVDASGIVAPWATQMYVYVRLLNPDADEDMLVYFKEWNANNTPPNANQGNEYSRLRAERNVPDAQIMLGTNGIVPCAGGKVLARHPAAADADNLQIQIRGYR